MKKETGQEKFYNKIYKRQKSLKRFLKILFYIFLSIIILFTILASAA